MSDYIFPSNLRGLQYPITETENWNTIKTRSASGTQNFISLYTYPWHSIKLSFSYLSDTDSQLSDIQTLMGFYNKVSGAGQDFLFAFPPDPAGQTINSNSVSNQAFGTGDGVSTNFRLTRSYGDFAEPIFGVLMTPVITSTVNGVTTVLTVNTDFTWTTEALITFTTAPVSGAILLWNGEWYHRCHFKDDTSEFQQIFYGGWSLDELTLESIKLL
jgi:uncharacterized protein (TIGR02217 family)